MTVVLTNTSGHVATVTLNRPERLNAVTEELYEELLATLADAERDTNTRAVVMTGAGRAFSAGADLKGHHAGTRTEADRARYVDLGQRACEQIQRMVTPVVAAVNGYALGAGAELAVAADFIVMAEDTTMGFPEVSIGTFVGGGVTYRLRQLVGLRRTTELLLLGERFSGRQAEEWGLANEAVPADAVADAADRLAGRLAAQAPLALSRMKAALLRAESLEAALTGEPDDLLALMKTDDWAEGVAAFAERRVPRFVGR